MNAAAHASGLVKAVKLYPCRGHDELPWRACTTLHASCPCWKKWPRSACRLCTHGDGGHEPEVDIFDREAVFIDTVLDPLRRRPCRNCAW